MSISRHTYLGPYFRGPIFTETVAVTVAACPNPTCPRHGKALFAEFTTRRYCPQCGTPIDRAFPSQEERTRPLLGDVSEAVGESLRELTDGADFPKDFGHHLWVPNQHRPGRPKRTYADALCGVEIALDDVDVEAEKAWLSRSYHVEQATLAVLYGGVFVETRWGLIRWCS